MELNEIRKRLKKELDRERYEHTKGVMNTAGCLAMAHEYSIDRAMLAGLLHDCAKCIPNHDKIQICQDHHMIISPVELENPYLLHAKAGAILAEERYGVKDPLVLHAIKVHTTGEPDMNTLDKIIYIADYIEPKRDKAPHLEYIRRIAFRDLDHCMAEILYDTLHFLKGRKGSIDPATEITYEFYKRFQEDTEWKH